MKLSELLEKQLLQTALPLSKAQAVLAIRYPSEYGLQGTSGLSSIYELNARILSSIDTPALSHPLGLYLFFCTVNEALDLALQLSSEAFCMGLSWGEGFDLEDEVWMGPARIESDRLAFWARPHQVLCPSKLFKEHPLPEGIGVFSGKKNLIGQIGFSFCELLDYR